MANVAKGRKDDASGPSRPDEDQGQSGNPELNSAVCRSFLALLGKPKDMDRIQATQVTPSKFRVNLWRRDLGLTDYAYVVVNEQGEITGVQQDRAKSKDTGIARRY